MTAETNDRHFYFTFWMRQRANFEFFRLNFPRTGWSKVFIDHLHFYCVMTFGGAWMLASRCIVRQQTLLIARRTIVHVTFVFVYVMTFRWDFTWKLTFWWFRFLFSTAGHCYCCIAASVKSNNGIDHRIHRMKSSIDE